MAQRLWRGIKGMEPVQLTPSIPLTAGAPAHITYPSTAHSVCFASTYGTWAGVLVSGWASGSWGPPQGAVNQADPMQKWKDWQSSNSTAMAQSAHSRTYLFRPNNTHLRLLDKPAMLIYPCPSGRRSKARRDSAGETRGKGFSLWELGQTPAETLGALLAGLEKQLQKHNA
ncbi:unnamed protein product [Leuciscus chuanchicus]